MDTNFVPSKLSIGFRLIALCALAITIVTLILFFDKPRTLPYYLAHIVQFKEFLVSLFFLSLPIVLTLLFPGEDGKFRPKYFFLFLLVNAPFFIYFGDLLDGFDILIFIPQVIFGFIITIVLDFIFFKITPSLSEGDRMKKASLGIFIYLLLFIILFGILSKILF